MKPECRRHLLPVLLAGFSITSIHAAPLAVGDKIGIDFGTTPTTNWNNFTAVEQTIAAGAVVNVGGTVVDNVSITGFAGGGFTPDNDETYSEINWAGLASEGGSAPAEFVNSVTADFNVSGSSLSIGGLDPSLIYRIYAVTVANSTGDRQDTLTITGASTYGPSTLLRSDSETGSFHTFTNVSPTTGGNLDIVLTDPAFSNPVLSGLLIEVVQPGNIAFAGVINDDAGSQISQWKTVSTTKTLDADGDNVYGTLAHLVYQYEFKGQNTLYSFDGADPQLSASGSYAVVDHPAGDGSSPADINLGGTSSGGGVGANHVMFTFTALAGSPANVRIGIATDGLDDAGYSSATIGLRQVGGSAVEYTMTSTNSTLDMVFFDVTGITAGNQFQVFADPGAFGFATHHFITWDAIPAPGAGYAGWASGFLPAFTNTAADLDFENDGLDSGIEWVVGGDPTLNDAASVAPTFNNTTDPDDFLFTFRRRDTAATDPNTTIVVEYGSNLTGWTAAQNAVNGVSIDDTTNLGGGFHQVTVAIPRVLAGGSGKLFARLKIIVGP